MAKIKTSKIYDQNLHGYRTPLKKAWVPQNDPFLRLSLSPFSMQPSFFFFFFLKKAVSFLLFQEGSRSETLYFIAFKRCCNITKQFNLSLFNLNVAEFQIVTFPTCFYIQYQMITSNFSTLGQGQPCMHPLPPTQTPGLIHPLKNI